MHKQSYLVRTKSCIVQFLHCILHVIVANKLDNSSAVIEDVSIADVARLSQVIL